MNEEKEKLKQQLIASVWKPKFTTHISKINRTRKRKLMIEQEENKKCEFFTEEEEMEIKRKIREVKRYGSFKIN